MNRTAMDGGALGAPRSSLRRRTVGIVGRALLVLAVLYGGLVAGRALRASRTAPGHGPVPEAIPKAGTELPDPGEIAIRPGQRFPDLALLIPGGGITQWSQERRDRPTVVIATIAGCDPCERELREWARYLRKHEKDPLITGLDVVLVGGASSAEIPGDSRALDPHIRVYQDLDGALQLRYRVVAVPSIFGLDETGVVQTLAFGAQAQTRPEAILRALQETIERHRHTLTANEDRLRRLGVQPAPRARF